MSTPIQTQAFGFRVGYMLPPEEHIVAAVTFDFSTDAAQTLTKDFKQEQANMRLPYIQTVFIDNSGDANALTLSQLGGIGQSITVKGNTQGYYPFMVAEGAPTFQAVSTGSAVKKLILFISVPVPPQQWATA